MADTIRLEEVLITSEKINQLTEPVAIYSSTPYATDFPLHFSHLNIRENVPGGIATFNIRGTTPQQNTIYWAGLELNNPMLGLTDLSLFPFGLFDRVLLHRGSSSELPFSGKPGGNIELVPSDFHFRTDTLVVSSANSINQNENHHHMLNASAVFGNTAISIRGSYSDFQNRYKFHSPTGEKKEQNHARAIHRNFTADLKHRFQNHSELTINTWLQNVHRQIPPTIFQEISGANQKDNSVKLAAHYRFRVLNSLAGLKAGFTRDLLIYSDSLTGEHSNSKIFGSQISGYFAGILSKKHPFRLEMNWQHKMVDSDAYSSDIADHRFHISGVFQYKNILPNLHSSLFLRKSMGSIEVSPILVRFEIAQFPDPKKKIYLTFENHYRAPTYNDLYWPVLGNGNLKTESGHAAETGLKNRNFTEHIKDLSISFFYRKTDDLIYWTNHTGQWRPENLSSVRALGLEAELSSVFSLGGNPIKTRLNYQFLRSVLLEERFPGDNARGKQLPYQPEHTLFGGFETSLSSITLSSDFKWMSRRFVAGDHSNWIDPVFLINSGISYRIAAESLALKITIYCDNLLNKDFFSVSQRPLPGRTFGIRLITDLNYKL